MEIGEGLGGEPVVEFVDCGVGGGGDENVEIVCALSEARVICEIVEDFVDIILCIGFAKVVGINFIETIHCVDSVVIVIASGFSVLLGVSEAIAESLVGEIGGARFAF